MAVWKLVHILSMFGAFALTLAPLFVLGHLARRGDAPAVGAVLRARKALSRAAVPLFLLGLVAGGMTQRLIGYGDFAPWLVATYALIVAYGVWDGLVTTPWLKRLERAFATSEWADKEAVPELLRSPRPHLGAWGGVAVVAAIESMMVLKPSLGL